MKKIIIIILFVLYSFVSHSQQDYLPYFQLKNKAEVAICGENYQEALNHYKQAFAMVDFPLSKEIHNAYLCAAIVNDTAYMYGELSEYSGRILLDKFAEKEVFTPYLNTPQWKELLKKANRLQEEYFKTINKKYIRQLDSLNKEEQKPRKKKHPLKIKNIKSREKAMQYWLYIDSCVAVAVDALIEKFDYPNEQNTGYKYIIKPAVCIWHRIDSTFFTLEHKALCEGKIEPESYAKKQDYISRVSKTESPYCEWIPCPLPADSTKKETVNANRQKIGLPTSEELKIMFTYTSILKNPYGFIFHIKIAIP